MGRPKASDPAVTRERVLEAAAGLFAERGYAGTTLSAIGTELGVSAAALYHHFDSKEDILAAYLEAGMEVVTELTLQALHGSSSDEQLRLLMRTYLLFTIGELPGSSVFRAGVFGYFQLVQGLGPERAELLGKMQRRYLDLIRGVIKAGIDDGSFSVLDLNATAFALVGMAAHSAHWFDPAGSISPQELADLYATLASNMVRATDA